MNPWIFGLILGCVAAGIFVWLTVRVAPPVVVSGSGTDATVVVSRRNVWTWIASVLTTIPLVGIVRFWRESDQREAIGFLALTVLGCSVGATLFIPARRKVIFSREGLNVLGFRPFRTSWQDVTSMQAQSGGAMSSIRFKSASGRQVLVDATMNGWHDLLRLLPELTSGEAHRKALAALAELNRCK